MVVLDDLPALAGLQGLPGLQASLPVAAAVLYGLAYPLSPKINTGTRVTKNKRADEVLTADTMII